MALGQSERQRLRRQFAATAGEALDAMFDDDQREQLITPTRREDRVLQQGADVCDGQAYNPLTYVYQSSQAAGGSANERWRRYERWLRWAWGGEGAALVSALTRASHDAGEPPKTAAESDPGRGIASART